MNTEEPIGFIGLGLMGRPMVRNLLAEGFEVVVASRSPGPVAEMVEAGATASSNPAEVARACKIIVIMVSDTPAVEAVVAGLEDHIGEGHLIVDMGTTATLPTRAIAERLQAKGASWIDAPVSGGVIGAEKGTLTIMAGGEEADLKRAEPALQAMGAKITHVGGVGCGQIAKAANQVIVGLTIGAVSEALALASHAGADAAKVREALQGGFADSRILEVHGKRMIDGTFAPGGKVVTQRKDMAQALDLAETLDLDLPATRLGRDLYDRLIEAGHGELDHSALFKVIDEKL
ncbi:MAG: NAD(P)-dependent oxidoreductase [Magnetovibrionaceae bacterium]